MTSPRRFGLQPAHATTGWLVGGGTDPESATVVTEYQKKIAEAVGTYEENIWRELEPEVALQLTQTEGEVKKLGAVLQVLRDEIESEKRGQEHLLREFRAAALSGVQYVPGVANTTLQRTAAASLAGTTTSSLSAASFTGRPSSTSHML